MMLQNLGLMAGALGLGGFPNFANHEFAWFESLGFEMKKMPANKYVGAGRLPSLMMRLFNRNPDIPYPTGLVRDGNVLLKPFCPPNYSSMAEAVRAVVKAKTEAYKYFPVQANLVKPDISEKAIQAAIAYCEYLWNRYGRFPVYMPPYRTVLGFQACHLDADFYDAFYKPEALSEAVRRDFDAQEARVAYAGDEATSLKFFRFRRIVGVWKPITPMLRSINQRLLTSSPAHYLLTAELWKSAGKLPRKNAWNTKKRI